MGGPMSRRLVRPVRAPRSRAAGAALEAEAEACAQIHTQTATARDAAANAAREKATLERLVAESVSADPLNANHYGPLYSGGSYTNNGIYSSRYYNLTGASDGSAFSGVWTGQANGTRTSQDYCNAAGCIVRGCWANGASPTGSPVVHDHGNASPSYFTATLQLW